MSIINLDLIENLEIKLRRILHIKWFLYEKMLSVIYKEDTMINQKLPSNKSKLKCVRLTIIIVLPKIY
jgi:hypothetical protein